MNRNEIIAHNTGVEAVLALALRSAKAIEPRLTEKPTRFNFAIGALEALADEGRELLLSLPPSPGEPADADGPKPSPTLNSSLLEVVNGC